VITRSRRILDYAGQSEYGVAFHAPDVDGGPDRTQLRIDPQTWTDMREPRQVTVTIEPGDLLNGRSAYWGDRPAGEETVETR
jgi:hypothetical protein